MTAALIVFALLVIAPIAWMIFGLAFAAYAWTYWNRRPIQCKQCGEFIRNETLFDRALRVGVIIGTIPWIPIMRATPPTAAEPQKDMFIVCLTNH